MATGHTGGQISGFAENALDLCVRNIFLMGQMSAIIKGHKSGGPNAACNGPLSVMTTGQKLYRGARAQF